MKPFGTKQKNVNNKQNYLFSLDKNQSVFTSKNPLKTKSNTF